jgi:hypothetical protein
MDRSRREPQLSQVRCPAQIDHQRLATDPLGRLCRTHCIDVADRDTGTESCEPFCHGCADAARRTGDHGAPTGKIGGLADGQLHPVADGVGEPAEMDGSA